MDTKPSKHYFRFHKNKKSEVGSYIFKTGFSEIKSTYKHHIAIYTDGSKQDEKVACAVITLHGPAKDPVYGKELYIRFTVESVKIF